MPLFFGPSERQASLVHDGYGFSPIMTLHLEFVFSRLG